MARNPRVIAAFNAMKRLDIPPEKVKPVLKKLLVLYNMNWDLIEDGNYRTLIDAYFELNEGGATSGKDEVEDDERSPKRVKQQSLVEGKGKEPISCGDDDVVAGDDIDVDDIVHDDDGGGGGDAVCNTTITSTENPMLDQPITVLPPPARPRSSNGSTAKPIVKVLPLHYVLLGNDNDNSVGTGHTSHETDFGIASSSLGEVKILLNCDSALRQMNFRIPKLDSVLKYVEDKYFRSGKIVGPQFSVRMLLKDLCESYLKLGTNSLDRSTAVNSSSDVIIDVRDASRITGPKKRAFAVRTSETDSNRKGSGSSRHINSRNLVHDGNRAFCNILDITKGAEKVKISLVNEVGSEQLPKFNYIPHNIIYQNANVNISLARIADEDCCEDCSGDCLSSSITCACARETGGEFAYSPQGLLKEEFLSACISMKRAPQDHHFVYCQYCPLERMKNEDMPERCKGHLVRKFIKECWRKCGCDMQCGNRVVQRGITRKLQVFLTPEGKGWGIRTLEDIPKGAFICEYIGEVLTNMELYYRILQSSGNERHTYPVTLDADWGSEVVLKDEEALCLDATCHGNVARFINHRCFDSNLIDVPVEVETPDRHYYHLAFFTTKKVRAFQELTWDYGIDFADENHPIKAFQCRCGSEVCRDKKHKRTSVHHVPIPKEIMN
uniref:Histone-lysine N-methyltransferase SUVR4 n=1 Tax=Quercus lobata TaxID=97700 RepID=A0A7N2L7E7_QUELO